MGQIQHTDVQFAERSTIREYLREINNRLRSLSQTVSNNRIESLPSLVFATATNAATPLWIASEDWEIGAISVVSTTAAGTVAASIGGAGIDGSPFALTASVVKHTVSSDNFLASGEVLTLTTAGITGTATIAVHPRRVN